MADNLKPYDPNKGFISFRLNPEAIKEELISFVPYNRTLRYFYDNPDVQISETAKVAASETPILGSLLAGEPVDAAKEAILLGVPVGPNYKQGINDLANKGYEFRISKGHTLGDEPTQTKGEIYAYKRNSKGKIVDSKIIKPAETNRKRFDTDKPEYNDYFETKPESPGYYAWYRDKQHYTDVNGQQLNKRIDQSNTAHDLVPRYADKDPYMESNKDMVNVTYRHDPLNLGESYTTVNGPLAYKLKEMNMIDRVINNIEEANKHKKRGEQVVLKNEDWMNRLNKHPNNYYQRKEDPQVRLYSQRSGMLRRPGTNNNYAMLEGTADEWVYNPVIDRNMFDTDLKALKAEVRDRNMLTDFDPYKVEVDYESFRNRPSFSDPYPNIDYYNALEQASQEYRDALNGPFLEDLLGYPRLGR